MLSRTPIVAGNWKMNKTAAEARALAGDLLLKIEATDAVEVVICPPFTAIVDVAVAVKERGFRVYGQNMHEEESGAYTGEISALMLLDAGASGVILGHSERRQLFGETDEGLARKVPAALAAGLQPILCVGESDAQREAGETEDVLRRQLEADLAGVDDDGLAGVVIAYEPIWAIGTGKTASPEQAQEACAFVRGVVAERDAGAAEKIRVLYGGSMKPGNAAELIALPDIDGGLIGGASLDAGDFAAIVAAAA
jgi:triosephosphate isomerase